MDPVNGHRTGARHSVRGVTTPAAADPAPEGSTPPDALAQPPMAVRVSFWMWLASAVILVAGSLLVVGRHRDVVEVIRRHPPAGVDPSRYDALASATITMTVVVGLVFGMLYVLLAIKVRARRDWARYTLTILTTLGALYDLYAGGTLYTLIGIVIALVAVALLYLPASSAYFAAKRTPEARSGT